jgi:hypothetical protein
MAIRVLKEVNRLPGMAVVSSTTCTIVGGNVVMLDTLAGSSDLNPGYIKLAANGAIVPLGLAIDSNVFFPIGGSLQAGSGFDYTNYNRGGLIGVFVDGGAFELYDDGRGNPCQLGDAYTLNAPVYLSMTNPGFLSVTGTIVVGSVMAVAGSAATLKVTIKSVI